MLKFYPLSQQMALNILKRSFSTAEKCSSILSFRAIPRNPIIATNAILKATFSSEERPRLGLRRQNLPPYPQIECIRSLTDFDSFLPSTHKIVKHGDYEFLESADGYVQMYIQGYQHPRDLQAKSGFSVYFGENHPLNLQGPVERRQAVNHAKLYAFLKGLQQIPENLIEKLCVCVDELPFLTFIDNSLRRMSENSFRSVYSGKLNKDLETSMEINKVLRMRQDLTLRMKYVPNDIGVDGMYHSKKIAIQAGTEATEADRRKRSAKQ